MGDNFEPMAGDIEAFEAANASEPYTDADAPDVANEAAAIDRMADEAMGVHRHAGRSGCDRYCPAGPGVSFPEVAR